MEKVDGAVKVAHRAALAKYEDMKPEEIRMTKLAILDTLGVILAATTLGNRCKDFVELAKTTGGKEEATVIGYGFKAPGALAAAANGALAHSLDFDDHVVMGGHQSAGSLEATLAALEYVGGKSGKDLILAFACGSDMVCRIHYCCPKCTAAGWVGTAVSGVFGGAVGAAKAMGLDENGIIQAIGWALWQTGFAGQCLNEADSDARENYAAFTQSYGFLSALFASRGMKSTVNSFDGQDGLWNKFYRHFVDVDPHYTQVEIGDPFEGVNGAFKPWCSCGQTHSYIQATRDLMKEYSITPDKVERIDVKVGNLGKRLADNPDSRYTPKKGNDARFSIPFTIACMLETGDVKLANFEPENLPKMYDTAAKVHWEWSEEIANSLTVELGLETAYVKITLKDGTVCEKTTNIPYGHTQNPMTEEDIFNKFRDCSSHSANSVNADKIIETVMNLENVDDINDLMKLLG